MGCQWVETVGAPSKGPFIYYVIIRGGKGVSQNITFTAYSDNEITTVGLLKESILHRYIRGGVETFYIRCTARRRQDAAGRAPSIKRFETPRGHVCSGAIRILFRAPL